MHLIFFLFSSTFSITSLLNCRLIIREHNSLIDVIIMQFVMLREHGERGMKIDDCKIQNMISAAIATSELTSPEDEDTLTSA